MSVDTRKPRTPTGGRSPGFDDEPHLIMAKVPSDPAQVIVNHASFRVQLASPVTGSTLDDTERLDAVPAGTRRRPVVWSGRTEPGGDPAAQLLQAVRHSGRTWASGAAEEEAGATQVLPRVGLDGTRRPADPAATVVGPRSPQDRHDPLQETAQLPAARMAYEEYDGYGTGAAGGSGGRSEDGREGRGERLAAGRRFVRATRTAEPDESAGAEESAGFAGAESSRRQRRAGASASSAGASSVRHAYYPGRRMNLGVVLLPMRVFLGLISVYAGMGKLSDPVYFDGGRRGSMVTWLQSLHPWPVAEPLRDFALSHPVGAGLTVAFLQVLVGVLTVLGLWQRVAAAFGALLSAALLVTVSWRTVPAYDAPDIIYLAAWSPLIIAGAPVYSVDARLASEAWRRLGPRVELAQLRRRVLRRGTVMVAVVSGLTLLFGSMLGGAVRSSDMVNAPGPSDLPTNDLPGSPLPRKSGERGQRHTTGPAGTAGSPSARERSARPSASASSSAGPGAARESAATTGAGSVPSQTQGATQGAQSRQQAPQRKPDAPAVTSGPASGGSTGSDGTGGGSSGDSGADSGGALGGLLG
ncbi:DoxX family membrane protein [Streptomyces sp. P1-3]|uniref:DoxX family protein n=1 Tax=Streptomyces sp. P1-3 TaxID=3421658 RepID=UPI003D367AB0